MNALHLHRRTALYQSDVLIIPGDSRSLQIRKAQAAQLRKGLSSDRLSANILERFANSTTRTRAPHKWR